MKQIVEMRCRRKFLHRSSSLAIVAVVKDGGASPHSDVLSVVSQRQPNIKRQQRSSRCRCFDFQHGFDGLGGLRYDSLLLARSWK